jgi:AcrR family transcriptional regulator
MSEESARVPRRRNAEATREAILTAAVAEFTEHGFSGVGVRQIADRAGVTAMMINRYFGSKEGLFAAAVDRSFEPPTVFDEASRALARSMAASLVARTAPTAERLDPFLLMLRSASDPVAGPIVRRGVEEHVGARMARRIGGDEAEIRAQLALALVAGTWMMRTVLGTEALSRADDQRLGELLTAMLAPVVGRR